MPAAALNNEHDGALSTLVLSACVGGPDERRGKSHDDSDDGGRAGDGPR